MEDQNATASNGFAPEHTALDLVMRGVPIPHVAGLLKAVHGVSAERATELAVSAVAFAQAGHGVEGAGTSAVG